MLQSTSAMAAEIAEIPQAARRLERETMQMALSEMADRFRRFDPLLVVTVARGSSDHAATCLSYAFQLILGLPVASLGPSIASVYQAKLRADRAAMIAISQSGASKDLIALANMLRAQGACQLVLTNSADSPLAQTVSTAMDVAAGPERAVAATKSFMNCLLAGLWLTAHWACDEALKDSLRSLPESFESALQVAAPELDALLVANQPYTTSGRGPSLGLAQEAALKGQEVLSQSVAAYSGAELLHGPASRMADGHGVVLFADQDNSGMEQAIDQLGGQNAKLIAMNEYVEAPRVNHLLTACLPQLVAYYRHLEAAAQRLGFDPDAPRFLRKKTVTQ